MMSKTYLEVKHTHYPICLDDLEQVTIYDLYGPVPGGSLINTIVFQDPADGAEYVVQFDDYLSVLLSQDPDEFLETRCRVLFHGTAYYALITLYRKDC